MRKPATLLALALALLTSGCGGGGHSSVLPAPAQPGHPVGQNEHVKFTFTIPNKTSTASRRAETISPSTQSIGVTVNSGTEQIFDAQATSPGCSVTESGITCTVTIDAAVGTDTFVVHAYSGAGGTGAILDSTTFTSTIVIDTTNTLNITLGPVVSTTADSGPGSLRQAIADANPGDTVTFLLSTPSTITLTGGEVGIDKNLTLSGPASGTITISGNNASRIFNVAAGMTVAVANLTFTQANGGTNSGGAIVVQTGASLNVTNSTFTNNCAYQGGAIQTVGGTGLLDISDSTFSGNTATHGAGYGDGGALYSNIVTTLTGDTFTGNADSAIVTNNTLTISGGTFQRNTAAAPAPGTGYGGALYLEGNATIGNAKFDENVAGDPTAGTPGYGGAIYSDWDVTLDNTTFTGNTAGTGTNAYGYGGAIYMDDGNLTITNSSFTSNASGGTNASYGYGGAISDETYNSFTLKGTTFTSNQTGGTQSGYGGAIDASVNYDFENDTFASNAAFGGAGGYGYGGALYVGGSGTQITNTSFTGNSATGGSLSGSDSGEGYGGAMYLQGGSSTALDGDSFTGNTVVGSSYAAGGALSTGSAITMNGGTFSGNVAAVGLGQCPAAVGGGAWLDADASMNDVSVANNKTTISATTGAGCLTALHKSTPMPMRRGARHTRASIAAPMRPKLRKRNINPYTADEYGEGGGIASVAGAFSFSGTVTNNSAATDGGGFFFDSTCGCSTVVITNSTIDSNSVTASPGTSDGGGAVYAGAPLTDIVTSTISNNTVNGDPGGADGGGGVYAYQPVQMVNDTITGNSAQFGGDIYFVQTLSLTNVTVMNGTATAQTGSGGDLYANSASALTLFGSIIAGGTASTQNNIGGDTQSVTLTDTGYNVINTSNSSMSGSAGTDITGVAVDPLLSALAANGGPTKTMADGATSPGKDLIPLAACSSNGVTTDQRGNPRGDASDNQCDAGAYEYP